MTGEMEKCYAMSISVIWRLMELVGGRLARAVRPLYESFQV